MLLRVVTIISFGLALILTSCAPEHSQIVLATFGNNKITMGQFEKAYENNVGSYEEAKKDSLAKLKKFLTLYVDFRMKLRNAWVRGFDKDQELQDELQQYKKQIGETYLLNKRIVEPGLDTLYNRRKWELRVSHIMFRPDSTGWAHAKELANEVLDSLKHGADFAKMAEKYSQDYFSKKQGGDLFYLTAGQLPAEFEDAMYACKPGTIYPRVVKTNYGYHIIRVTEKRPRIPEIRASHILIKYNNGKGKVDTALARARIDTVMMKLKAGEDFAKVAKQYSEDPGSKENGGDLGFFSIRMMVEPFAEAAFKLKNIGDISPVVQTNYGFHIIKLTGRKPYPTFDEEKAQLKKIFKQQRFQGEYDALVDSLKNVYNFKLNDGTVQLLEKNADSVKVGQPNPKFDALKSRVLFTYNNGEEKVSDFIDRMNKRFEFANKSITPDLIKEAVNKISGEIMIELAADNLDQTDPGFADLMDNYKNGIYIFKLQQDEVWDKINTDSTKLHNYWEANKDKYSWPERIDFAEIFSKNDSLINAYYDMLKKGADFDSLAAKYTERPGFKAKKGDWGPQPLKSAELSAELAARASKLKEPGDYTEPFQTSGGWSIVKLVKRVSPELKTFKEAKAEVSGALQDSESKRLEDEYVGKLKKLYNPEIYYDKLEEAFKD